MSMICPNCATENLASFRFCQSCGTPLPKMSDEFKAVSATASPAPRSVDLNARDVKAGQLDAWLIEDPEETSGLDFVKVDDTLIHSSKAVAASYAVAAPYIDAAEIDLIAIQSTGPNPDETYRRVSTSMSRSMPSDPEAFEVPIVVQDADAELTCTHCGTKLEDGHRFCGKCGSPYADKVEERELSMASRRSVARVSFVSDSPNMGPRSAAFALSHVNDDGSFGEHIPLFEGDNVIGRASSNALNADRFVSPRHMRISCRGDCVDIRDLQSLNGIFRRINSSSVTIHDGTAFRIGEELLIFSHGDSKQALLQADETDDAVLLGSKETPGWGYLSLILGAYDEGDVYRLSKPSTTIGRTHGDILFPRDGFVSGVHASLRDNGDSAILTDLDSSNGTFLKFKELNELRESIFILLGNQLLNLRKL